MRKASTLVAMTLFALAATARAQEAAPAATTAAPPASDAAAGLTPPPAAATAAPSAANVAAAPAPDAAGLAASPRKLQLGLAFLPMAVGKFTSSPSGTPTTVDAAFAYGVVLSASYEVLPGLLVGLAPQFTFNVGDKNTPSAAKELDILARVAYAFRPVETIAVYAEALPGYSIILPPSGGSARGLVLVFGIGSAIDITDRIFANVGVGYQIGFQNRLQDTTELETRTRYVRGTIGGGVKF